MDWPSKEKLKGIDPTSFVAELCRRREGWTAKSWVEELFRKANCCERRNPGAAAAYRAAANLINETDSATDVKGAGKDSAVAGS